MKVTVKLTNEIAADNVWWRVKCYPENGDMSCKSFNGLNAETAARAFYQNVLDGRQAIMPETTIEEFKMELP